MRQFKRNQETGRKPMRRFKDRSEYMPEDRSSERSRRRPESRFRRDSDRSGRQPPEMHDAVCDNCGKGCTVPFRPTGNKPVFCSDCFKKRDNSFSKPGFEQKGRSNNPEDELAKINSKLDRIMDALEIR